MSAKIKCESCGHEISIKAAACPSCGHPNEQSENLSGGQVFMGLLVAVAVIVYMANGGSVPFSMDSINKKVANDSIQKYDIAKSSGNNTDACITAGVVAASYLQAKDNENYQKWQLIKNADCKRAGL